jgi:hypothetical protein
MAVLYSSNSDSSFQRTHQVRTPPPLSPPPKWQQNQFLKLAVSVKGEIYPVTYQEGKEGKQRYNYSFFGLDGGWRG